MWQKSQSARWPPVFQTPELIDGSASLLSSLSALRRLLNVPSAMLLVLCAATCDF
jgi:hypothetical protein